MRGSVFSKTLYDKRWFIFGWSLGFIFLAALMVTFYPAMHQSGSLDQLVKTMPPAFQGLIGDISNLRSFDTYLAAQLFDIRLQLIGGVMVVILALGLTVAEEDAGFMKTMLALPISRTKLLIQKWLAMALIIAVVVAMAGVSILVFQNTIGESIDVMALGRLLLMTWLVLMALASIVFGLGTATGIRPLATGLGILVLASSFILTTFSTGVDWLKDYEKFSLFYYYPAVDIAKHGITWSDATALGGIALVVTFVSWLLFRKRDLR